MKGGLGNQLFCYAAARRLALVNNAELVIDDVSGFKRDFQYHQKYVLDNFHIQARKASRAERLEPFERYRRGVKKWIWRRRPFGGRRYLEQEGYGFDERLLWLKINGSLYLDGYWQSENYFKDVEETIRKDLKFRPPIDVRNQRMADQIRKTNAVALHVRSFGNPTTFLAENVSRDYYTRSIKLMEQSIESPHYFVFSNDMDRAQRMVDLKQDKATFVLHDSMDDTGYADLWLMTLCRHFITANSTFSWWGAWLAESSNKIVICPNPIENGISNWAALFSETLPSGWMKV